MAHGLPQRVVDGPSLFNIVIRIQPGRKHKLMRKLGLEPGSPDLKSNALPTNQLLLTDLS